MKHPYATELKKTLEVLQQSNEAIKELLSHKDLFSIKTTIEAGQVRSINYLNALLGQQAALTTAETLPAYGPVTHFFGKKLERQPAISKKDLTPAKKEQEIFFTQRDKLYAAFQTTSNDDLLKQLKVPGGENLIRAVAKKIGFADYKAREIDIVFLDEIREFIVMEIEENTKIKEAEDKLKQGTTSFTPPAE